MDPALDNPFGPLDHPHGKPLASPQHSCDESHHSQPHDSEDVIFDQFVAHREDEPNQPSQAAEALEDRRREHIDESDSMLHDYVQEN